MNEFLFNNWGNLASVAGLIMSGVSAFYARTASGAAIAARDSVLFRTMAEEVLHARNLASQIENFLRTSEWELAAMRCRDLRDLTTTMRKRWDTGDVQTLNDWLVAQMQLESVDEMISKARLSVLTVTERQSLANSARRVSTIFLGQHGLFLRKADQT